MKVSQQIKMYATDDIASIIKMASHKSGIDFKLKSLKFDMDSYEIDSKSEEEDVTVMAIASVEGDGESFEFYWAYPIDGDDIYIEDSERELANSMCNRFKESKKRHMKF